MKHGFAARRDSESRRKATPPANPQSQIANRKSKKVGQGGNPNAGTASGQRVPGCSGTGKRQSQLLTLNRPEWPEEGTRHDAQSR